MMIEKLEEELKNCHERATQTAIRGRLINCLKEEIKKTENASEKERLQEKLKQVLVEQRHDLDDRYVKEFLKEKAILGSAFTTLPKGVGISVERVKNTIEELKEAKTNKERIFKAFDLLKSIGQTALTPILYAGKFTIRHWYAFLITLGILDITDSEIFKKAMNLLGKDPDNSKILKVIEDIKSNVVVDKTREITHKIGNSIEEKINEKFGNVIDDFKQTIKDKIDPFSDVKDFFQDQSDAIKNFIEEHKISIGEMKEFLQANPTSNPSETYQIASALCNSYDEMALGVQKTM